jgi:hypothetical protein
MHRSQHRQAQHEHDDIGRPPRQAERVVKGTMRDAQAGQEKDEGGGQRQRIRLVLGQDQRSDEPRRREQQFARGIGRRHRREIAPVDLVKLRSRRRVDVRPAHLFPKPVQQEHAMGRSAAGQLRTETGRIADRC